MFERIQAQIDRIEESRRNLLLQLAQHDGALAVLRELLEPEQGQESADDAGDEG
jgi:hypothetical protein